MRIALLTLFLHVASSYAAIAISKVSQAQWDALNATVKGRLRSAAPFSRPCFNDVVTGVLGEHDVDACSTVVQTYTNPTVRSGVFGSYMNTEWETCQATSTQCLLDNLDPGNPLAFSAPRKCSQGSIPPYFIDVREVGDVQAAFAFSRSTDVPLVVKNTGHDYSGRSSGANSLALWLHNLQGISYHATFVPEGCGRDRAARGVTFAAGTGQGVLYDFADAHNLTLPGGGERSVASAGGYLQGGGHTAFANAFGLAVDRVLEVKMVTPDGEYRTASSCQNTDLFFAVRGGGGGTFGVVLEVTMLALPQIAFPTVFMSFDASTGVEKKWLQFAAANALKYAETGWGGYITPRTGIVFANPLINISQAAKEMETLKEFAASINATFSLTLQPSFLSFFNVFLLKTGVPVGLPFLTTSRLVPADNFRTTGKQAELVDTLIPILDNSQLPLIFVVGTFFFKDGGGTSINPVWRKSLWHVTASTFWNFNTTLDQKRAIYSNFSSHMDRLRKITPGSGTYFNEADVREPDHTASFWGDNYDRLVEIKRKYDPDHLLDCWQCGTCYNYVDALRIATLMTTTGFWYVNLVDSKGPNDARFSCYL